RRHGLLDDRLERARRGLAAASAALQVQVDDALVVEALILDLARVRAELGQDLLDRASDAGAGVERVQVMDQQQALHQRIRYQLVQDPRPGPFLFVRADNGYDLGQPGAVQLDQAAH